MSETVVVKDSTGRDVRLILRDGSPVLFYRYRGQNWLGDNADSVRGVDEIVRRLRAGSAEFRNIRVICYSYNEDHYVHSFSPAFPAGARYRVQYCQVFQPSILLGQGKLLLTDRHGKVLVNTASVASFSYVPNQGRQSYKAKLLTEKDGRKQPLASARVVLLAGKDHTLGSAQTDRYGDFELNIPPDAENVSISVRPGDSSVKNVIVATQQGVERWKMQRMGETFELRIIEADRVQLSDMEVPDDLFLKVKEFRQAPKHELVHNAYINYASGSYYLPEESKKVLDHVALLLSENPDLRLEVSSHTDSRGDAGANQLLSEKRSLSVLSYLILIGVHKDRLSFIGKGEMQIRNRCTDGVDCSEMEHAYNRRTEFRFVRD